MAARSASLGHMQAERRPQVEGIPRARGSAQTETGLPGFTQVRYELCNAGILAGDDHLQEFTGCAAEEIPNCWNCVYPLTAKGYFGGLEWDPDDPDNAVLHAAVARLKVLHPLPEVTYGIPVQRTCGGIIECEGSTCSIGCQKRCVEDDHAYNVSEQDALTTAMAMDAGVPLDEVVTGLPRRTLCMFGGIYTHAQYNGRARTHNAAAMSSDLLVRRPTIVQEEEKQEMHILQVVKSKYRGFLLGTDEAEPDVFKENDQQARITTTELTYSTNMEELDKRRDQASTAHAYMPQASVAQASASHAPTAQTSTAQASASQAFTAQASTSKAETGAIYAGVGKPAAGARVRPAAIVVAGTPDVIDMSKTSALADKLANDTVDTANDLTNASASMSASLSDGLSTSPVASPGVSRSTHPGARAAATDAGADTAGRFTNCYGTQPVDTVHEDQSIHLVACTEGGSDTCTTQDGPGNNSGSRKDNPYKDERRPDGSHRHDPHRDALRQVEPRSGGSRRDGYRNRRDGSRKGWDEARDTKRASDGNESRENGAPASAGRSTGLRVFFK